MKGKKEAKRAACLETKLHEKKGGQSLHSNYI